MKGFLSLFMFFAFPLYGAYLLDEGFEITTFPPTGWDTTRTSVFWGRQTYTTSPGPEFGTAYARVKVGDTASSGVGEISLITPMINLGLYPGPETLSFYYRFSLASGNFGPNDTLYVDILPNGDPSLAVPVWHVRSGYGETNVMTQVKIDLSPFDGTNIRIRFRFKNRPGGTSSLSGNTYFWLDLVRVYAPDLNAPPTISILSYSPINPDSNEAVNVYLYARDPDGSISSVNLRYRYNSGSWQTVSASLVSGDTFVAVIPAPNFYSKTKFYAVATDNVGDTSATSVRYVIQGFKTIAQARALSDSDTVQVKGVLTANTFNRPEYIQDATAGIAVFDINFHNAYLGDTSLGKLVAVAGILYTYYGLREIINVRGYTTLGFVGVPDPIVLRISDIGEPYEGMLIRVNNVQFTTSGTFAGNTNYIITDGIDNLTVRIDADTDIPGMTIPTGPVSIIGILGQYGTTYQLLPRSRADIIIPTTYISEKLSGSSFSYTLKGRTLILKGKAKVYSPTGKLVFEGEGKVDLRAGAYFVVADRVYKILVK
jgi:hypothetical protein